MGEISEKVQERRMQWYGTRRGVRRKEDDGYRSARKQERKTEEEVGVVYCVKDDLREKGLSGEEVYDRAAWRRLSSHIDPT